MQQYIFGNVGQKGYRYVSSEQAFFADGQRTAVLQHLVNYDSFCFHGDLEAGEHQSYWMAVSNLDNPAAPDRLYLQASGSDPHRTGYYARGYLSDAEDGYLFDSRLLRLLRTEFSDFAQTMADAEKENLHRIDSDMLPCVETLQPASLDEELLRNILLALLQKKKVIIRLPDTGREAMKRSRAYILAIYERLPYEQRAVNGFVTGVSAAKLRDQVALPEVVRIILMDADAQFDGVRKNAYQEVFDLANPDTVISPMPRENKEGKQLAYVPLIDFLAQQSPEVLDEFFSFCRSFMRKDVNGNSLSISEYSMYYEFFTVGREECTDSSIRSWAANVYKNANSNSKWTPEIKKMLFGRIASTLSPDRLKKYLLSCVHDFTDLVSLGVVDEEERSQIQGRKSSDYTVKDIHAALTLKMLEYLVPYYDADMEETLTCALSERFLELGCKAYPFLQALQPNRGTMALLKQFALPEGAGKTTALVVSLRDRVYKRLYQLRDETMERYSTQYAQQCAAGLARIEQWPGSSAEPAEQLFSDLRKYYLFEELIEPGGDSGWNDQIGEQLIAFCRQAVPENLNAYQQLLSYAETSVDMVSKHGGRLNPAHLETVTRTADAWRYVQDVHRPSEKPAEDFPVLMADIHKLEELQNNYPREAWDKLSRSVISRLVSLAKMAHPCLTEDKPTAGAVAAVDALVFPSVSGTAVPSVRTLIGDIHDRLESLREQVRRTYGSQYTAQHRLGLKQIEQWCAIGYESITVLLGSLRQHYLYSELIVSNAENSWCSAIGSRAAVLCRQAAPKSLQYYRNLCSWMNQNLAVLAETGIVLDSVYQQEIDQALQKWNHVLKLSERRCETLTELLTLFADIRNTEMDSGLAEELMQAGMAPVKNKGLSRSDIFGNLQYLAEEAAWPVSQKLLAQLINGCRDLKRVSGACTAKDLDEHLHNCTILGNAGLKEGRIAVDAWSAAGKPEELHAWLRALMDYCTGSSEPEFINRPFRNWAAQNLQSNSALMHHMAVRFPEYRQMLIPVLAQKPDGISAEQIMQLYVSGCQKKLLIHGAGENTCESWKAHTAELFPEWTPLPEPNQLELPAENTRYKVWLIVLSILLTIAGLIPGGMMLAAGTGSVWTCVIWIAALIAILAFCEITAFVSHNQIQRRFSGWLGLGAIPGLALALVVLLINLV